MKKFLILLAVVAIAIFVTIRYEQTHPDGDDVEAVYEGEAYDIDDAIDPNDEEAYARYGGQYDDEPEASGISEQPRSHSEESTEPTEQYTGPSEVDVLDMPITDTIQIDTLLDEFETNIKSLRRLYTDQYANSQAISNVINRVIRMTDKINEGAEGGHVTPEQLKRYETLTNEFLAVVNPE